MWQHKLFKNSLTISINIIIQLKLNFCVPSEDFGEELLPGETINDHSLQVSELVSQFMKISQYQTIGILKPTGLHNDL